MSPTDDSTTVIVDFPEMEECYRNRDTYVLSSDPLFVEPSVEFHHGEMRGLFYRTVRVSEVSERPYFFTTNILEALELTEDRTIKDIWEARRIIAKAVLQSTNPKAIEAFVTTAREFEEHHIDMDWSSAKVSKEFLDVVGHIAKDTSRPLNRSALHVYETRLPKPKVVEADMLPLEINNLKEAIAFCRRLNYSVDEFPITIVESLGEGVLGMADRKSRTIFIAKRSVQTGVAVLAATLIEEWCHIKHNLADCSRGMQNWLLEQLTNMGAAYLHERDSSGE
jgi:hypothetical protein